jgi:enoyl-CoA hydratase/carnithine racemase
MSADQPYKMIAVEIAGAVGVIELDDAEHLNPTDSTGTLAEINDALVELGRDRNVLAVVISGRGSSFSAGANLGPKREPRYEQDGRDSSAQRLAYGYAYGQMWEVIHGFKKPLVAAVKGYCLGGGWELAHACDLIVAGESAKFGAVEIDIGLIPFATSTNYLPKMIGKHRAMDLILNARRIDARTALDLGLVNEVVPDELCFDRAKDLAADLATRPPIAVAFAKHLVKKAMDVTSFYDLERAYGYYLTTTEDHQVAREARAKRASRPEFHGR